MDRTIFTRRGLLQFGVGGYLGLNLGGLLRAQSSEHLKRVSKPKIRACILIFYYGGPSHLDTFDMKPKASENVRGEFRPTQTSVPGLHICEHLPFTAKIMHKVALIRSMHHRNTLHDSASIEALTGRASPNGDREEFAAIEQFFPCHGATLSYLRRDQRIPIPHVALPHVFRNVISVPCQGGGFLGSRYDPLQISVDVPRRRYRAGALSLPKDMTTKRLHARRDLLRSIESTTQPSSTVGRELNRFRKRAYELLESKELRQALDLSKEPTRARERYGFDIPPRSRGEGGGGNNGAELGLSRLMRGQNLLLARRLVQAGIPFVNVYDFKQQGRNWDAHFKVASQHKNYLLPIADQSFSALIEDLDAHGLLDTTLVVAMGEFGRTPKINKNAGRDHWPHCYTVTVAGGGVKGGFVFGSSDSNGAYPDSNPVTPGDLAATIFWRFGIDPETEIHDVTGRPYKIAEGQPIRELFG